MGKIALNYTHLSKNHAGGKDQVGLNLLKGFYEMGVSKNMLLICFEYSKQVVKSIAPDIEIITLKSIDATNELKRMSYLCFIGTWILPKLVNERKISVIYHLSCNNGLRKLGCKSIVIPHDIKAVAHRVLADVKISYYKYFLYKLMYAVDFKYADSIIAISEFDKSEICKYYPQYKNKVKRIYNPILITSREKKIGIKPYICALNLQFHHKNIITLIKAFELVRGQIDGKLVLIGNVPKRVSYLKDYVRKNHLEEQVEFTGFIEEDKLYELFANAKLYVNPTLYEGFGMTAIEAIILKVPALISNIPANIEVTKGLCEYYGPPEDEKELARRMLECYYKSYTPDYLESCSKTMMQEYGYLNISRQYDKLFEKLGE